MPEGQYTRYISERFLQSVTPRPVIGMVRVLLYDFATGESALLPRHIEGINQYVLPLLRPSFQPVSVWIGGLASRRGEAGFNWRLSRARAASVARYILNRRQEIGPRHSVRSDSFGEELSREHTENSEYYRSALVVVNPAVQYQAERRAPDPVNLAGSAIFNRFRIHLRWLAEGGELGVASFADFVLDYDVAYSESPPSDPVRYELTAGGVGLGLLPAGAFRYDPAHVVWNRFTSPTATHTRGFVGTAQLASYGLSAGPIDIGGGSMLSLSPSLGDWSVAISPFNATGSGLSSGASVVGGPFVLSRHPP